MHVTKIHRPRTLDVRTVRPRRHGAPVHTLAQVHGNLSNDGRHVVTGRVKWVVA